MKKKLVILVLLSSLLFIYSSCKEEEPIELRNGLYDLSIVGLSYCEPDNPRNYNANLYLYITKIDKETYSVYTTNSSGVELTPKTLIMVNDKNKISAKIHVMIGMGIWIVGNIEGEIGDNGIMRGKYRGREYCYHSTAPVKGSFTLEYEKYMNK